MDFPKFSQKVFPWYALPPFQGMVERLKEAAALADEKEKSLGASDENCGSVSDLEMLLAIFVDLLWIFHGNLIVLRCSMDLKTSSQDFRHFCFKTFWVRFEQVRVCVCVV